MVQIISEQRTDIVSTHDLRYHSFGIDFDIVSIQNPEINQTTTFNSSKSTKVPSCSLSLASCDPE